MKAKLVIVSGEARAQEIRLKLPAVIGRGKEATIHLPLPLVSRKHCELFEIDGQLAVRDLGSLNGIQVNQQKMAESMLPTGTLLTVGSVTFQVVCEADDPSSLPPSDGTVRETSTKTSRMAPKKPKATATLAAVPQVAVEPPTEQLSPPTPIAGDELPDFIESAEFDDSLDNVDLDFDMEQAAAPAESPAAPELPPLPAFPPVPTEAPVFAAPMATPAVAFPIAAPVSMPEPVQPVAWPAAPVAAMPTFPGAMPAAPVFPAAQPIPDASAPPAATQPADNNLQAFLKNLR